MFASAEPFRDASPFNLKFGPFEVHPSLGELRKDGVRVPIQEKPLRVLTALVERQGDLVTRAELHQQLWQGETFVDFDTGLNTAVRKLRSALGDESESPHYIETLPKRGYRFLAPVELVNGAAGARAGPGPRCHYRSLRRRMDQRTGRWERRCGIERRAPRMRHWLGADRFLDCGHAGYSERRSCVAHLQPARLLLQLPRFRADCRF